ncbi:hypothetical protein NMY22_g7298 [Coprinellus aureogranulatus]|nr:hypothetical protein NMY22_g7298 [Coprinellus aureogranulatus]
MGVTAIESLQEFRRVTSSSKPVVVYFWAAWCGSCRIISPIFEIFSDASPGIAFYKIEVVAHPEISKEVGIRAMPTFFYYKGGEKKGEVVGADPAGLESRVRMRFALLFHPAMPCSPVLGREEFKYGSKPAYNRPTPTYDERPMAKTEALDAFVESRTMHRCRFVNASSPLDRDCKLSVPQDEMYTEGRVKIMVISIHIVQCTRSRAGCESRCCWQGHGLGYVWNLSGFRGTKESDFEYTSIIFLTFTSPDENCGPHFEIHAIRAAKTTGVCTSFGGIFELAEALDGQLAPQF